MDAITKLKIQFELDKVRAVIDAYAEIIQKTTEMFNVSEDLHNRLDNMKTVGLTAIGEINKEVGEAEND